MTAQTDPSALVLPFGKHDYTAIPDSVLAILRKRWRLPEGYSAFDATFNDPGQPDRRRDPSFYFIQRGAQACPGWDPLSHAEVVALINDRVFGTAAMVDADRRAIINEHAEHALQDLGAEVYEAWAKFEDRIRQVEAARRPPWSLFSSRWSSNPLPFLAQINLEALLQELVQFEFPPKSDHAELLPELRGDSEIQRLAVVLRISALRCSSRRKSGQRGR